jgi:predicted nucleic acid-binding protein
VNLFIDTNIYLNFYHYSSDDLEELKKLAVAIKNGEINLYLTDQVKDEFERNREAKIADALKRFTEQKVGTQFPQICKEYDEYKKLRQGIRQYKESRDRILQKLRSDAEKQSLIPRLWGSLAFASCFRPSTADCQLSSLPV